MIGSMYVIHCNSSSSPRLQNTLWRIKENGLESSHFYRGVEGELINKYLKNTLYTMWGIFNLSKMCISLLHATIDFTNKQSNDILCVVPFGVTIFFLFFYVIIRSELHEFYQ